MDRDREIAEGLAMAQVFGTVFGEKDPKVRRALVDLVWEPPTERIYRLTSGAELGIL